MMSTYGMLNVNVTTPNTTMSIKKESNQKFDPLKSTKNDHCFYVREQN